MGRRGPKPTDKETLERRGSWRSKKKPDTPAAKSRTAHNLSVPSAPTWLPVAAKTEWTRVCKLLADMQVISTLDRAILTDYCVAWANLKHATVRMNNPDFSPTTTTDKGNVVQHPLVAIQNKAMEAVNKFARELGLTPVTRSSVNVLEQKKADVGEAPDKTSRYFSQGN